MKSKTIRASEKVMDRVEALKSAHPNKTYPELLDLIVLQADGSISDIACNIEDNMIKELLFLGDGEEEAKSIAKKFSFSAVLNIIYSGEDEEKREELSNELGQKISEFVDNNSEILKEMG